MWPNLPFSTASTGSTTRYPTIRLGNKCPCSMLLLSWFIAYICSAGRYCAISIFHGGHSRTFAIVIFQPLGAYVGVGKGFRWDLRLAFSYYLRYDIWFFNYLRFFRSSNSLRYEICIFLLFEVWDCDIFILGDMRSGNS